MNRPASAVVVGDERDPHVQAVTAQLDPTGLVVVDAARLDSVFVRLSGAATTLVDVTGTPVDILAGDAVRGWIRKLAPAGWDHGATLGSHRAAVLASRLTLLGAVLRDPSVNWLTAVDDLYTAENKITQYKAAMTADIRVPEFSVSNEPGELADLLGEPFVLKPLGPGNYVDQHGAQQVVFVRSVRTADLGVVELLNAPFLAQRIVHAERHLRVVTVGNRAWVAELDATSLPLDWRQHGPAHGSFRATKQWEMVEHDAVKLAAMLRVGFSSQDWVVDKDGAAFLDLNPGGQWLFLPDDVTMPATTALAAWLRGEE